MPGAYAHVKYNSCILSFQTDPLVSKMENEEKVAVDDHPPGEGEPDFSHLSSMNPVKLKRLVIFLILLLGIPILGFLVIFNIQLL